MTIEFEKVQEEASNYFSELAEKREIKHSTYCELQDVVWSWLNAAYLAGVNASKGKAK